MSEELKEELEKTGDKPVVPAIGEVGGPELIRNVKGMWGVKGSGDTSGFTGLEKVETRTVPVKD